MDIRETAQRIQENVAKVIVGKDEAIELCLVALMCEGHVLLEDVPGIGKTTLARAIARSLGCSFKRIQFTPDLLPGDVTGTEIYRPQDASFHFQKGPIFHNLVLADEVNRAPAKVQSALLEAMAERQVSVGSETYQLPELFLVMATQNPIEQEGTYPLPEAQLDRFLMHVSVGYPDAQAESKILQLTRNEATQADAATPNPLPQDAVFAARKEALTLHMSDAVEQYIVQLIIATRDPAPYSEELAGAIEFGGSPRATIALDRCARAHAWLHGRDFVGPDDVQAIAADVLRHRLILSFEAEANGVTPDQVINKLLALVPVG